MSTHSCDRESAVRRAVDSGHWTEELHRHAASCEHCSDLILVTNSLLGFAESIIGDRPLPDPGYIWWRAQVQARADAAERATRVITVFQRIAVGCAGALAAFGAWRAWPLLEQWLASLELPSLSGAVPSGMAQPGLVIAASIVLLVFMLLDDRVEPGTGR